MDNLVPIRSVDDIFPKYRNTPIDLLLQYHNLNAPLDNYEHAEVVIGMCMDNRKQLRIPDNFAYILRTGGGNLRHIEFKISYAVAVGGVKAIALIGHDKCGMVNLMAKKDKFVQGLVDWAGWDKERAEEHFMNYAPMFEIDNEIDFVISEARRLRQRYPKILVVPLFYGIDDKLLYLINE
ncbi:carbonic anhydrase [Desulfallas thermosapovorans]|uniref:Carbonic anhydrase n=1 Tax=Desulfallas thermosapovorans DSM 6562 TaxID=1121431 RepID=A0A5S5A0F2_9FIRM|nr:carbonic anhydrase [Desulfallas thermosapovorans]TYO97970.1 carbonic anhydrase [Desulfallas thermosapovorans DSM 6562]